MTISLRAAGTATSATAAVTAINPAVPTGTTTGDLSVLSVWMKPYSTTITTPAGWTKIGEATNGTTASGTDTGSTKVAMFVKESAAVGAIGNITLTGANTAGAVINTYQKSAGIQWDYSQFSSGGDTTNAANFSATAAAGVSLDLDDWLLASTAVNGDVGTLSAITLGVSGTSLGTTQTRQSAAVTTGNDCRGVIVDAPVTGGASNQTPFFQYTNASSGSGTTIFLRVREVDALGSLTLGGSAGWVAPAFTTLTEDWSGTWINSNWTNTGSAGTVIAGQLSLPCPAFGSNTIQPAAIKSLVASEVVVEVASLPAFDATSTSSFKLEIRATSSPTSNLLRISKAVNSTDITFEIIGPLAAVQATTTVAYSATNHRWWRIKETAGFVVTLDSSPDGTSWTTQATFTIPVADPNYWNCSLLLSNNWVSGTVAPATVIDNFNLPPSGSNASGSLTLGGSASGVGAATASGSLTLGGSATGRAAVTASGSLALGGTAASVVTGITGSLALAGTANWRVQGIAGSLTLGGSGTGSGAATATGSLTLGGSATARAAATASGSLSLGGSAASVVLGVTGSLALAGSATARGAGTATGSLTLGGSAASVVVGVAGSLTLDGSATATAVSGTTAAGDLTLGGSASAAAAVTATGSLTLGGSGTARAVATAAGSLVLGGTANWRVQGITGSLALAGSGTARAVATATGSLALGGTANWQVQGITGSLALAGSGTARAAATATGSLSLAGTANWRVQGITGTLTLAGSGTAQGVATGTGSITLVGSAVAQAPVTAAGSLTLDATATAGVGGTSSATGSLNILGAAQVGVGYANTNDRTTNAHTLPTLPAVVSGDITGFADHDGYYPGAFWTFTPTETRSYVFDTWGSPFDTILRIYGSLADAAIDRRVAVNDDVPGGGSTTSRIPVTLHAGTTYYIKVSGYTGATGPYVLRARIHWANFAYLSPATEAAYLPSIPFTYYDETIGQNWAAPLVTPGLWWKYVPSESGTVVFDTVGTQFNATALVIAADGTTVLAEDNDSGGGAQASLSYAVTAGTLYYLVVSGTSDANRRDLYINVRSGPQPTGPALGGLVLGGSASTGLPPVTGAGTLDLGGSAASSATITATGSVDLTGSATALRNNPGTGSITLSGSATGQAPITAGGDLTLGGTFTAGARVTTIAGSVELDGTFRVTLAATAAGHLDLNTTIPVSAVPTLMRLVYGMGPGEAHERERRPRDRRRSGTPFAGLSPRIQRPLTPNGLLLYMDGTVIVTPSWDSDPRYWTADDRIPGGTAYTTPSNSWQALVLVNAGYTLEPVS